MTVFGRPIVEHPPQGPTGAHDLDVVMADSSMASPNPPLNPQAQTFQMPTDNSSKNATNGVLAQTEPTSSGPAPSPSENEPKIGTATQSKSSKSEKSQGKAKASAEDAPEAGAGKLTAAQLKKQKAAEKAARRAEKVAMKTEPERTEIQPQAEQSGKPNMQRRASQSKGEQNHKRRPSELAPGAVRLPLRTGPNTVQAPIAPTSQEKALSKRVAMLSHLYPTTKRASLATAGREIHPAVLALGLQLRDYVICGANARTVATMLVLKKVIQAYTTPAGVALSRHMTTHLSHQISYLTHARPLGVAQGNSIRWLKKLISQLEPDLAEQEAKRFLGQEIDAFIREKVTLADEVIAREASGRIADEGDVILTYGKSSVVEKTLITAMREGKKFKVIVADSRPLFEGKNLARSLLRAKAAMGTTESENCQVQYCLLNGLADVIEQEQVTKCFLGASAMLGNGRLSSRSGTAMVACMAKERGGRGQTVPVIVLCESIKFTAKVALDSIIMNEVADPDFLVEIEESNTLTSSKPPKTDQDTTKTGKKGKSTGAAGGDNDGDDKEQNKGLEGWKDMPNLYLVNLMYDLTPSEYLDMVISELGSLPPSAVPVVNGVHGGDE